MRVPRWLAWILVLAGFFTAGLLRQFHDTTPSSPFAPPAVGSLLFACVVFLVLVAARERGSSAAPGPGIRLGSLTPILLMLLVEKWVSISLYNPVFYFLAPRDASPALVDGWYRAFAGAALLVVCVAISAFSRPTTRATWRLVAARRAVQGAAIALTAVGVAYAVAWGVLAASGSDPRPGWPPASSLTVWLLAGQAIRAFAEELYYRGFLMGEILRLATRLGARADAARRWVALVTTSVLFGMEHVTLTAGEMPTQWIFTIAIGILLGMLVMASRQLWIAALLHAWINWLVLGVAPVWSDARGRALATGGAYVSIAVGTAFLLAFAVRRATAMRRDA